MHSVRSLLAFSSLVTLLFALGCGDDGPGGLGDDCNAEDAMACEEGLGCFPEAESENTVCAVPPGGECDIAGDGSECFGGGVCFDSGMTDEDGEPVGTCALPEGAECDPADDICGPSLTCAERTDGTYACHDVLVFRGMVSEVGTGTAIEGAHVIALDVQPVAVTDIAVSAADGSYELEVPALRDTEGAPVPASFTLRASAQGYETFPSGIRTALPIDTETAEATGDEYVVETALTDVQLIPLEDPAASPFVVSGTVVPADPAAGVLVVAEAEGVVGLSAISDASGAYTIFNVPEGAFTVMGYKAGLQLTPVPIDVSADMADVNLEPSDDPLAAVSGMVQIVNTTFVDPVTSVVLVPASTFTESLGRGEVPSGLRAPPSGEPLSIRDTWSIPDVPAGRYVALAAFENDRLVRDPDPGIAGTDFVYVDVANADIVLEEAFKITEALETVSPGAERAEPIAMGTALDLRWSTDSSVDHYEVVVFDAVGNMAWSDLNVPADVAPGSGEVVRAYEGPMELGMYYQFKVTSMGNSGGPISTTEDLRGVFYITE